MTTLADIDNLPMQDKSPEGLDKGLHTQPLQPDACQPQTSPEEEAASSDDVLATLWEDSTCPHFPCC